MWLMFFAGGGEILVGLAVYWAAQWKGRECERLVEDDPRGAAASATLRNGLE